MVVAATGCAVVLVVALLAALLRHNGGLGSHTGQPDLAATVNGIPVTMASYRRQLVYAREGYDGPGAPGSSPTGQTVEQIITARALQQAIAEVLIDSTARQYKLSASPAAIDSELARMRKAAGGTGPVSRQMQSVRMTVDELTSIATHNVLRDRLAGILHSATWLEDMFANAQIRYLVGETSGASGAQSSVSLGQAAPPFVVVDLHGRAVSLADLHGRAVVVNFWASWSGYSAQELPLLAAYARSHTNLYVVALNHGEDAKTVRSYIREHHLQGLTVWRDVSGDAYASYRMAGLPATFFIDSHSILRSYNYGALADMSTLADQAEHAVRGLDNTYYNQGR